jgi:murein DD-endopeptidase MepM/ murein hydrolase activator NlpD
MKLQIPWPSGYSVNKRSPYGPRVHPITRKRTFHHGVDVALPVGSLITAPADAQVVHKGDSKSGGFTLILKHAPDLYTVYYHLQKPSHLPLGAKVEVGEVIALSGNTGASTGPHLHFEVRKSARWGDTVDPMPYLQSEEIIEPVIEPEPTPEPVKPARPEPKWKPSAALARGFNRIRRAVK